MALRKKRLKMVVTTMAIVSLLASSTVVNNNIYADSSMDAVTTATILPSTPENEGNTEENTQNKVQNVITYLKDGEASRSGVTKLRDALSRDTLIETEGDKTYMTLEFTQSQYSMIDNVVITVDGNENTFTKSDDRKYKVEIKEDLTSEIVLKYDVIIPIAGMPPHSFSVGVSLDETNTKPELKVNKDKISLNVGDEFDAKNYIDGIATASDKEDGDLTQYITASSTLKANDEGKIEKAGNYELTYSIYDINGETTTKKIAVEVLEKQVVDTETDKEETDKNENTLADGKYKVENNTTYTGTSSMGSSMVRNSLEKVSYVEVKDGKTYVTLEFSEDTYEFMKDITISVDGKNITVTDRKVTFEVSSIDSEITIAANITAMGDMRISYNVNLDSNTLEKVSSTTGNDTNNNTNGSTSNGSSSNESTNSDSSSSNNSTSTESIVKKGKLYTIKNTVHHESETGVSMARKYLNSTSKVEQIDGQYYVTLTFTGSEFMKNHVIYVNGSKVSHTVTAKSGDSVSLRFKVGSLSDSIKVGMYVVPMSRDIEFTVKLVEDTLTFVKEYEVSSDASSTLPQTGSVIDGTVAMGVGTSLMALGTLLNRRKRK